MEMNSVMATEIVAAEVEHIVLPQIVSIKQASRMLGFSIWHIFFEQFFQLALSTQFG